MNSLRHRQVAQQTFSLDYDAIANLGDYVILSNNKWGIVHSINYKYKTMDVVYEIEMIKTQQIIKKVEYKNIKYFYTNDTLRKTAIIPGDKLLQAFFVLNLPFYYFNILPIGHFVFSFQIGVLTIIFCI